MENLHKRSPRNKYPTGTCRVRCANIIHWTFYMSILNPHKRNIFASVEEEVEIDENFPHTLYGSDGVTLIGLPTRESVPHKFQPKPTTYDEPIVFQSHTHLWKARLCSIFHLSTPFLFVLIIFVIFTYTNCLLQIFAQFTVEEQYRVKVSKSLEGIHRLRDLTDHLSPELQGQILKGAMELIPWSKSIDNNTWLACTDRNCTHVIDPLYDVSFTLLPFISPVEAPRLADWYLVAWGALSFVRFMFLGTTFFTVARRYLFLHSVIFFLRGLSIAMTIVRD